MFVQKEQVDSDGNTVVPAGMHVVFLPFAEDMRKLPYEQTTKASDVRLSCSS